MIASVVLIIVGLTGVVQTESIVPKPMNQLPDQRTDRNFRHEDEGSGLSFQEDKPRIDRFAEEIKSNRSAVAYIIAYGGLVSYKNEAAVRLACIRNYLITAHGISGSRLKLINGGYRTEVSVRLYLVNPGEPKPTAYSMVNREAVRMKKAPKYPCGKERVLLKGRKP